MSANPNLVRPDRDTMLRLARLSDMDIARMYGCTGGTAARWRDRYGIPRSLAKSVGNVKWQTNRDFFARIDTPAKAYILGFILADGHIRKEGYKVEISVKESDASLLDIIAREAGCDAPLRPMINGYDGSRMARLRLCGQNLIEDLNALGLYHDKSVTATWPAVPAGLESHLARGIWDGDGYIGRTQLELIGTSAVLDGLAAAAQRHTGCVLRRRMSGKDRRYHYLFGSRRDADVLHWMYSGAGISLARKQKAYSLYWT